MSRARRGSAGIVLVAAMAIAVHAPAFAGGPANNAPGDNLLGTLAGSQLSTKALSATRGGSSGVLIDGVANLNNAFNTTNNTLNVDSSSDGLVSGTVNGSVTGAIGSSVVSGSTGFVNQFANTGNNVMINSSMAININAQ